MISVFDIFKIGIGPSSSHTVGPMKAGKQFTDDLIARNLLKDVTRVVVDVYGSLSLTGKGHHTDIAIIMGLAGNLPDTVDIDSIPGFIQDVNTHGRLMLANGQHEVEFPVDQCMNFHADNLSLHENGMRITALAGDKVVYSQTYYSIGGGFIVDEEHFGQTQLDVLQAQVTAVEHVEVRTHAVVVLVRGVRNIGQTRPAGVGVGRGPEVELVFVHRVTVVGVERLDQLAADHHVALENALQEDREVDAFPCDVVGEAQRVAREGVAQIVAVVLVDGAVAVAVLEFHVARLDALARRHGRMGDFVIALEEAVGLVTVVDRKSVV